MEVWVFLVKNITQKPASNRTEMDSAFYYPEQNLSEYPMDNDIITCYKNVT